jgi:hypothetical protein
VFQGLRDRISIWGIRFRIWLGRRIRVLLGPGSFVIGLIAAVYAASALLKHEEIPSETAWNRHHPLGWLLVTSGVVALVGTYLVFAGYSRVLRKAEKNDELQEACRGLGISSWRGLESTWRKSAYTYGPSKG